MYLGMFQPFILHTYNMSVIYWNSREAKTCCKYIYLFKLDEMFIDCYRLLTVTTHFKIFYIPSTFTNIIMSFISITFCCSPLKQCLLLLSYVFFLNQNLTFFGSFIISLLRMTNFFLLSKISRVHHECAFEFTDWLF